MMKGHCIQPERIAFLDGKRFISSTTILCRSPVRVCRVYPPDLADKMLGWQSTISNYGEFIKTDLSANNLGTFGGSDVMISTSLAMKHGDYIAYGGSVEVHYEN